MASFRTLRRLASGMCPDQPSKDRQPVSEPGINADFLSANRLDRRLPEAESTPAINITYYRRHRIEEGVEKS
jgi:hypothetical protein